MERKRKIVQEVIDVSDVCTGPGYYKNGMERSPESNPSTSQSEEFKPKKRKLHTFEKRRLALEKIRAEKAAKREEISRSKEEREQALQEYHTRKRRKYKLMNKKTKRGQPKLSGQVEFLLEKLQRQIKHEQRQKK